MSSTTQMLQLMKSSEVLEHGEEVNASTISDKATPGQGRESESFNPSAPMIDIFNQCLTPHKNHDPLPK